MLAEMKDPVVDVLRDYGLLERFTPDRFAPTVGAAVDDITGPTARRPRRHEVGGRP